MRRSLALCIVVVSVLPTAPRVLAADWPNWRGPTDNNSIATGNYPTAWTVESVSWKFALPGKGSSTPIIWKDRIYLTTPDEERDAVLALDFQGHKLWLTRLGEESPPKQRQLGSSCNASPVTDGKGIFVYFRSCCLAALELDGSVRWTNDLAARFGPEHLFWDTGSSPVVTDQQVILCRMHHGDSWIAGFDKATGALRSDFVISAENDLAHLGCLSGQFVDQSRTGFRVAESGLG
jgi:outer membrane protein assembly factor BamB